MGPKENAITSRHSLVLSCMSIILPLTSVKIRCQQIAPVPERLASALVV